MTKLDRLLRALDCANFGPGDLSVVHHLANSLDGDTVDQVTQLLGVARRAGRTDEQRARARRTAGRKRDPGELGEAITRQLIGLAGRARDGDLDAAAALHDVITEQGPVLLSIAVHGLAAQGLAGAQIGQALGITQQAVSKRLKQQPEL